MHEMITTDAQRISVTRDDPHRKLRARGFDPRGHGGRAAMDAMESEAIHVVGKAARTTDAGNKNEILTRDFQVRKRLLRLRKNRVVAAARAPAHFLIRHEVLALQFDDSSTLAVLLAIVTHSESSPDKSFKPSLQFSQPVLKS